MKNEKIRHKYLCEKTPLKILKKPRTKKTSLKRKKSKEEYKMEKQ